MGEQLEQKHAAEKSPVTGTDTINTKITII